LRGIGGSPPRTMVASVDLEGEEFRSGPPELLFEGSPGVPSIDGRPRPQRRSAPRTAARRGARSVTVTSRLLVISASAATNRRSPAGHIEPLPSRLVETLES
jgi:hypothetical protein